MIRASPDHRMAAGAVAGAVCFDIAARSGLATISAMATVIVAAAAIVLAGRPRGRAATLLVGAAPALALLLAFRSSPWVIAPAIAAIVVLLVLGASLGADGSGPSATFPALATRIGVAACHIAMAPGMLRPRGAPAAGGTARKRAAALARGVLLAAPVVLVIGILLASADPIFRSWFDLPAILQHVALGLIGAWAVIGLLRAANAEQPSPPLPSPLRLGMAEAAVVLGGVGALYTAFVAAQFVALSDGGRHVLVTQGLTYAQYARSGFFQLLACAAITLGVLLGVRACANPAQPALKCLSALIAALTVAVVFVAIRRLQFYEAAFGLTMLRLACLVVAAWIGLLFVLLAATIPGRGLPSRHFPAVALISGILLVGLWGAWNPASFVAQTNLRRAEHGRTLDARQAAGLGPDATPALVAGLARLDPSQARGLLTLVCARPAEKAGGTAFNASRASANESLARACGR